MKKLHLNPILRKELKLGARSFKFYLAVAIYAAVVSFFSIVLFLANSRYVYGLFMPGNASGYTVDYNELTRCFAYLSIAQIVMICIIVPILTAASIAGERERQTLDIMLTAPVTSFSIAWGKLMAALANVFIFIISTLPALSISFLYGGIKWRYMLVFLVQIMALAFFIGAIGVWSSAVFKKTIVSVIITLIYEGCFFGLPFAAYLIIYLIKYQHLVSQVPAGQPVNIMSVDMGWSGLVLLFCPILTAINAVMGSVSSVEIIRAIFENFIGSNITSGALVFVISIWSYIGIVVTVVLGFLFLLWTARIIDRPGKIH